MKISRALVAAGLCVWFTRAAAQGQALPHGVASGDVTSTSIVLWAASATEGTLTFEWGRDPDLGEPDASVTVRVDDPAVPAKARVDQLEAGTTYYFRATDTNGLRDTGRFVTPPTDGRHGMRFGVSGDWRGELKPYPSIANLPSRELDLFVALGDTIYADVPSPAVPAEQARSLTEFRAKHAEVYRPALGVNHMAAARAATSWLVTIDDHEVANDFAGGAPASSDLRFGSADATINETELFSNGLSAFTEYHPLVETAYDTSAGEEAAGKRKLYRYRTWGTDAAFFLLDTRSFRDTPLETILSANDFQQIAEFLESSFDANRTMLGATQLAELQEDLRAAEAAGITWKFICVPEPIQNITPVLASDRFEGYAHERQLLLRFIEQENIPNVVFISADIHGTLVNNLTYQRFTKDEPIDTRMWEITTGSVAYAPPFGQTVFDFADIPQLGFIVPALRERFPELRREEQDTAINIIGNALFNIFGIDPLGLADARIPARLLDGIYVAANSYGWTEFEIDATTQELTVTTWGIDWYDAEDLARDADAVLARTPSVMHRFRVDAVQPRRTVTTTDGTDDPPAPPVVEPPARSCGVLGMIPFGAGLLLLARFRRH